MISSHSSVSPVGRQRPPRLAQGSPQSATATDGSDGWVLVQPSLKGTVGGAEDERERISKIRRRCPMRLCAAHAASAVHKASREMAVPVRGWPKYYLHQPPGPRTVRVRPHARALRVRPGAPVAAAHGLRRWPASLNRRRLQGRVSSPPKATQDSFIHVSVTRFRDLNTLY